MATAREKFIQAIEDLEDHGKVEHDKPCSVCHRLIALMQEACVKSGEEFLSGYPNLLDKGKVVG